jgi:hypothetical protein
VPLPPDAVNARVAPTMTLALAGLIETPGPTATLAVAARAVSVSTARTTSVTFGVGPAV